MKTLSVIVLSVLIAGCVSIGPQQKRCALCGVYDNPKSMRRYEMETYETGERYRAEMYVHPRCENRYNFEDVDPSGKDEIPAY